MPSMARIKQKHVQLRRLLHFPLALTDKLYIKQSVVSSWQAHGKLDTCMRMFALLARDLQPCM